MPNHIMNTVITIDLKEYARLKAVEQAARGLIEYRDHNVQNWQLEKADDFINAIRRVMDGDK